MAKVKKLRDAEVSAFCQQILMVVVAGLPTYYGISILRDEASDMETKELLNSIYRPMEDGCRLYEALQATEAFPSYMVHMIQLGEETGHLEEVLRSLAAYYEREAELRDNLKNAVTYPVVMTVMMLAVLLVLLAKVLPFFANIYKELGSELTGFAHSFMNVSILLDHYLFVLVILVAAVLLVAFLVSRTEFGKMLLLGNSFHMSIAASRFANAMFLALASGLDTDQGLALASQLADNPYMSAKIEKCKEHIKHNETFSNSLLLSGIFSEVYSSWITIGSKTGAMDDVMRRICISCEQETESKMNRFLALLEPSLVILLSVLIGAILISFLLPLLGIMSSIG